MKAVKHDKFRRAFDKCELDIAPLRRPKVVSSQKSYMDIYAKRLRGGDRRAVNMQLHEAKKGDFEIDVVGSGQLLKQSAFFSTIFVNAT